ncbi:aldo/keto reductase [Nonomuraea sp. NN258]|uniref:aldo/keto reductase n=1 Tax=Nonomuraea antri TaxID=2730852 RepID=UPI00156A0F14|nr:aldo/keto reductase [Nonomuraea antri]NRQ39748.1 aldo/keto reductase [Nonomuraea antri]
MVPRRRIGRHGPEASVLSLGSWHTYDRMDFKDAVGMLRHAVDIGINLFDVGVYGLPENPPVFTDVLFSAIVRGAGVAREDYLLSAKLWLEGYPEQPLRAQLERALFRAGTDHADLAVLGDIHRDDLDLRRLAREMAALESEGLLGCWGVNNWSATSILTIRNHAADFGSPGPQLAQLKYSPCRRSIPEGVPFSEVFDAGISLQASDVLEGGILAGKASPARPVFPDAGGVREQVVKAAEGIAEVAAALETTPAQLCVAFCLTHPAVATVLFGATSLAQLVDNAGALDLVRRVGAARIREVVAPYWVDGDLVDPEGP